MINYVMTEIERDQLKSNLSEWQRRDFEAYSRKAQADIDRWLVNIQDVAAWITRTLHSTTGGCGIESSYRKDKFAGIETWDDLIAKIREIVETAKAESLADAQDFLDDEPERFASYHLNAVVVEGRVVSARPDIYDVLDTVMAYLTPYAVWHVAEEVRDAGIDAIDSNMFDMLDETGNRVGNPVGVAMQKEFDLQIGKLLKRVGV